MARKWFSPVSVIVFVLGLAMVVWSLSRGDDSAEAPPDSAAESTVSSLVDSAGDSSTASAAPDIEPSGTESTGSGSSSDSSPPVGSPTATTIAPSTPTATIRPVTPGGGSLIATTTTAASIPPLAATPGAIASPQCLSFAECSQKLFDTWLSSASDRRTRALNYGTPEAVRALFELRTIGVVWDPTVYRSTARKYVAAATSHPKGIEFNFTSGQTDFKVQSVVWF